MPLRNVWPQIDHFLGPLNLSVLRGFFVEEVNCVPPLLVMDNGVREMPVPRLSRSQASPTQPAFHYAQ